MSDATTALIFDRLPNLSPRPENAADHTGKRRGRMTAIAWCRPSRSGKGTVWVCRCDCGLFEYRRPGTWASKPFPEDRCRTCLHTGGLTPGTPHRCVCNGGLMGFVVLG